MGSKEGSMKKIVLVKPDPYQSKQLSSILNSNGNIGFSGNPTYSYRASYKSTSKKNEEEELNSLLYGILFFLVSGVSLLTVLEFGRIFGWEGW